VSEPSSPSGVEPVTEGLWPLPPGIAADNRNAAPIRAYYFLQDRANREIAFTLEDLANAAGWTGHTPRTYVTKQWRQFIEGPLNGSMRVTSRFLRLTLRDFLKNFTQSRKLLGSYSRSFHAALLSYEFLLPLTRERELRIALDRLFFKDTVAQRIREIGLVDLQRSVPRSGGATDDEYIDAICGAISSYFGGYSIVHVQGRFRAVSNLLTRQEAGKVLAHDDRYLIDETTASVRFIVPCQAVVGAFEEGFGSVSEALDNPSSGLFDAQALTEEVARIRELFFGFFVEAVVDTVQGEDEIWLIETAPSGQRLFKWSADY